MTFSRLTGGVIAVLCTFAATGCDFHPSARAAETTDTAPIRASAGGLDSAAVARHVAYLADDRLAGRATPSEGLELAARYVADRFAVAGLEPAPGADSLIQRYTFQGPAGPALAPNVVAVLRGGDPVLRDTWVVFSAHMDHVGTGPPDASGDTIYNGADDDASGTAAVLEIARAFAALPERPDRSIAFVVVSGEELGLFGSQAFMRAGGILASAMVADVNIDMVGRNAPDSVVAIGMPYSDLGDRIERVARENPGLGLTVVADPWPEERFFFRSDHYNFAIAGVPAIFLFAGVHPDYHRPSDEAVRIDAGKIARVGTAAFLLGLGVARDPEPPRWTAEGRKTVHPASR